jgi:hypothetical protein
VELEPECGEGSSDVADGVEVARVGAPDSKLVRAEVRAV